MRCAATSCKDYSVAIAGRRRAGGRPQACAVAESTRVDRRTAARSDLNREARL